MRKLLVRVIVVQVLSCQISYVLKVDLGGHLIDCLLSTQEKGVKREEGTHLELSLGHAKFGI